MQWLLQLLPKQKMQDLGDGNIQAGRVGGDVNHSQHSTTQHIYNTFYVVSSEPIADAAANESRPAPLEPMLGPQDTATHKPATPEQHEVLRIMRSSPSANAYAEEFMQKQFGTTRVKRLNDLECRRTKGYVEACLKNEAARSAPSAGTKWG